MTGDRKRILLVAIALIIAIVVGGIGSKVLLGSNAASKRSGTLAVQTINYGALQARIHTQTAGTPFLGPYKVGQCGPGVRLMEGALRHMRQPVRTSPAQSCFGRATKLEVEVFQRRLHYRVTGVYNAATHLQVVKRGGYSKRAKVDLIYIVRQNRVKALVAITVKQRAAVLTITAHAALIGDHTLPYTQGSERQILPAWPRIPPDTDCSGYATWVLWQAGVGARVGYFGAGSTVGWTGTLRYQGKLVGPNAPLQVGDLVFYGQGSFGHVAVYIGHGLVSSHGQRGIDTYPYSHDYRGVGMIRRYIY